MVSEIVDTVIAPALHHHRTRIDQIAKATLPSSGTGTLDAADRSSNAQHIER